MFTSPSENKTKSTSSERNFFFCKQNDFSKIRLVGETMETSKASTAHYATVSTLTGWYSKIFQLQINTDRTSPSPCFLLSCVSLFLESTRGGKETGSEGLNGEEMGLRVETLLRSRVSVRVVWTRPPRCGSRTDGTHRDETDSTDPNSPSTAFLSQHAFLQTDRLSRTMESIFRSGEKKFKKTTFLDAKLQRP